MSPFLYTALPAIHKLDPDRCVQSVLSLKNLSVGLSCAVSRLVQDSYCTLSGKLHMTDQQIDKTALSAIFWLLLKTPD